MHRLILNISPQNGLIATITSFILGVIPEATPVMDQQTMIIFWFQLIAFSVTIIAGTLTTINAFLKYCDRKKKIKTQPKS